MLLLCALLLGVVAGLRSMLAPAMVSWFARCGVLAVASTPLAFMGYRYTPIILTVFAIGELIVDKLPTTPSRKAPVGLTARIVTGGLSGATIGAAGHMLAIGLILGIIGAVAGTFGGSALRAKLAAAFKRDLPAALLEDVIAIAIAVLSLMAVK
jgi:uncharacterized membrane protein